MTKSHRTRLLFLVGLLLAGHNAQQAQPQALTANLEGWVLHRGDSEPIPRAQVTLVRVNPNLPLTSDVVAQVQEIASLMQSPQAANPVFVDSFLTPSAQRVNVPPDLLRPISVNAALSDGAGGFSFKALSAGRYILTAKREGFLDPLVGGYSGSTTTRIVVIENGKQPAALEIRMIKGGTISGKVYDPQGQPVFDIPVEAYQLRYPNGQAVWDSSTSKATNDRGEFRLFGLLPGQYFLGAVPSGGMTTLASWARTYFPGTTDPTIAQEVTIREGEEVKGIDINIRTAATRTYTISGTAINPLPDIRPNAKGEVDRSVWFFYLVPHVPSLTDGTRAPQVSNAILQPNRPNGEFEIRNVKPGSYDLYPYSWDYTLPKLYIARALIEVRNADISGLSLSLSPGATLKAEIVLNGTNPQTTRLDSLRLNFRAIDLLPSAIATSVGTFQFDATGKLNAENIPEVKFGVALTGLPPDAYIADVRQSDQSIYDEGVVVGKDPSPIRIYVNLNGTTVTGVVQMADGSPAANISVILVPPAERRRNPALFKVVSTNEDGRFSISGVMPGPYSLLALQDRPFREPWLNADYLAKYEGQARSIIVGSGSATDVKLDLISN